MITAGMSTAAQVIPSGRECPSPRPRTELMVFVKDGDQAALGNLLLDIANYPKAQKAFLHWWHSLPLGGPIIPNPQLTSLLFTFPPFDEEFATFQIDGERVDVLWVVPISESEVRYFNRYGVDALEKRFETKGIDVADLLRKSVV